MKILNICAACAAAYATVAISACADHHLPSDPVRTMPVKALVIEVNGEDYTAVPSLTDDGAFASVLDLAVKIPSVNAKVTTIALADGYSCPIAAGDLVTFSDDYLLPLELTRGNATETYTVRMSFNPPPFFYFVKSSDSDSEGARYFIDLENPVKIASGTYDRYYEGEVDLTASNWDNVGLVTEDLSTILNLAAGPWPAVSFYSWIPEQKAAKGDGYFPSDGPWNDWLATNGNPDIVSPGVWRVNYDSASNVVDMTMTQWAVSGSAVAKLTPMRYDASTKSWSLTAKLNQGSFIFETIPVAFGDPRFNLGLRTGILGQLGSEGDAIEVGTAGEYRITLTLSNSPYYTFSLSKI